MLRFECVSEENQVRAGTLERRLGQASARAHAAMADLAIAAAEFDGLGGWSGGGIRSFEHWLAIETGFDPHTGRELLRVGRALRALPRIAAAFAAGQLSFDKVREVTTVASPETDELMLEIARGASGSQLSRICRSLRRMTSPEEARKQQAERGLWARLDDDGMMRLVARLRPEDGAIVMAAIQSRAASIPLSEAEEPHAARRADALVAMSEQGFAGESPQLVVHVDVGVLTGEATAGACRLENGGRVSAEAARRIGCDAEIVPLIERQGLPIDVGRIHRSAPPRLRRALEVRDKACRFPGCGVPARMSHVHHVEHWALGGPTSLDNLMLLCGFHHRAYHDGAYRIVKTEGGIVFETADGHVLGEPRFAAAGVTGVFPEQAARAEWGGARLDVDHVMFVLGQRFGQAEVRAGPS